MIQNFRDSNKSKIIQQVTNKSELFFHLKISPALFAHSQTKIIHKIKKLIAQNQRIIKVQMTQKSEYFKALLLQLELQCAHKKLDYQTKKEKNTNSNHNSHSPNQNGTVLVWILTQNDFRVVHSQNDWYIFVCHQQYKQTLYQKIQLRLKDLNIQTKSQLSITERQCYEVEHKILQQSRLNNFDNETCSKIKPLNRNHSREGGDQIKYLLIQNIEQLGQILQFRTFKQYERQCKLQQIMFKTELITLKNEATQNIRTIINLYEKVKIKDGIKIIIKFLNYYCKCKRRVTKKYFTLWRIFSQEQSIIKMNNFVQQNNFFQDSFKKSLKSKYFNAWMQFVKMQKREYY